MLTYPIINLSYVIYYLSSMYQLSVHPSTYLSIHLSIICLSICLSISCRYNALIMSLLYMEECDLLVGSCQDQ